ncbi:MAG: serine hydrolase, partial [Deltaproteobacteria bacterium]|nr:serine hydrolase [Deltaproteobacteria bacterium]
QKILLGKLYNLLVCYHKRGVFSAAAINFYTPFYSSSQSCLVTCGALEEKSYEGVRADSLFDLASLTKPLVTLLSILSLIEKKNISWNESLESLLECSVPLPMREIDLLSLLSHSSGLAAHREYCHSFFDDDHGITKSLLKKKILSERPEYKKNEQQIYSDLGYMLLGLIVEKKAKKGLDHFWYEHIANPLGLKESLHYPRSCNEIKKERYVTTGTCRWSGRGLKGIVHDDNCRFFGGVCGHAGLFGTASAVLALCHELLLLCKGEKSRLTISSEVFAEACSPRGKSEWTAGFNRRSDHESSSGDYFSSRSIGHLGFTGTSFWIDPEQDLIVVILTNRVIKGDDQGGIKKLRPEIHNMIVEHLRTER